MDNLIKQLRDKNLILTTAESCTGGMLSAAITEISGASDIFDRGFITYSNAAKIKMLGVSEKLIHTYGAVSEQCAAAMAQGALENSNANIAISITGIAGPNSDETQKPVGLVYIGLILKGEKQQVTEHNFKGTRKEIRHKTCDAAMELLLSAI